MEVTLADEIIGNLRRVHIDVADQRATISFLSHIQRLRGILDALEITAARRLHQLTHNATAELAKATQRHTRAGDQVYRRGATLAAVPSLAEPLQSGRLQAAHIDTVTTVLRTVDDKYRQAFDAELPELIEDAAGSRATPDDLARTLNRTARTLENGNGISRFAQQRRDTALHIHQQHSTELSVVPNIPEATSDSTASPLSDGASERDEEVGDAGDGGDLDEWTELLRAGPSRLGRPEVVVVVDARQGTLEANRGSPVVDWGLPIEVPQRALEDIFQRADAHPVIVANGVVLHAPGEMNLGRTTRLASRAQRRALRALYPTCAVPGCCVAFEFTKPHHVHHWEHGGPTDLAKVMPLCSKHHHTAHEGGWKLTLQPNRHLTITLPNGTILTTGPPRRIQAA